MVKLSFSLSFPRYSVLVSPYGVTYFAVVGDELVSVSPVFIPFLIRLRLLLELTKEIKELFEEGHFSV